MKILQQAAFVAAFWGGTAMAADLTAANAAALGIWGGDRLQMTVDAQGARLQLDCASGTISTPLVLDVHGGFATQGTFEAHQPGPQRADESAAAAARYSGTVKGDLMTLTIQTGSSAPAQVFKLHKGVKVKLVRCL